MRCRFEQLAQAHDGRRRKDADATSNLLALGGRRPRTLQKLEVGLVMFQQIALVVPKPFGFLGYSYRALGLRRESDAI